MFAKVTNYIISMEEPPSTIWIFCRPSYRLLQEEDSEYMERLQLLLHNCMNLIPTPRMELEMAPLWASSQGTPPTVALGIANLLEYVAAHSRLWGIIPSLRVLKVLNMNLASHGDMEGENSSSSIDESKFLQALSRMVCLEHFTCDDCLISDPVALGKVLTRLTNLCHIQVTALHQSQLLQIFFNKIG